MKLFLIDPHDTRLYKNNLFNPKLDSSLTAWKKIREYLLTKNIVFDTIDLHPVEKAEKIFFFDHQAFSLFNYALSPYLKLCIQKKILKEKMNLVITECPIIKPEGWMTKNHQYYGKVFTWDDSLVDNKKYFHYRWLQNFQLGRSLSVPFEKKKLIVLINAQKTNYLPNELYSLRVQSIRYFEKTHPKDFDLYGVGWEKPLDLKFVYSALKSNPFKILIFLKDYVDSLGGFPSYKCKVADKIGTLIRYKFCLCFENMKNIDGYITEKIFDCFKANCVPVYYGASNINDYIPKNTFIDFRQFNNFDIMYKYIVNIDEKIYNEYLNNINKYIKSNEFKKWSYKNMVKNIFLHDE